jgi:DNA-binding transcriptional LysR family regulator
MNLEYVNTFIEVVKVGNLSIAAKKLYISQPTVSFHIKRLEEELGYRLIERDTRNFLLTPNGKRFFKFAEYVFQEHKHLLLDMAQIEKGATGRLSVAAPPILGEYVVPNLINKFKEDNPTIDIFVEIMEAREVVKTVTQNPDMVGFCRIGPKAPNLNYAKLGEDEMVLIVYPGHPFTMKNQISIADLIGETLIFRAERVGGILPYAKILKQAGIDLDIYHPKIVMGTSNGVLSAVESKVGIGFISNLAIKNSKAMGLVQVMKIKNVRLRNQYFFVHNKNIVPDSLLAKFIDFLNQSIGSSDNN